MQSDRDWKPNPRSAPCMIQTGVLEVEGEERYHYADRTILKIAWNGLLVRCPGGL